MKKFSVYFPYFCFMLFTTSLFSQEKKQINTTIKIMNGDTIINGKNLKDVTPEEGVTLKKNMKLDPSKVDSRISLASPHINKRIRVIKDGDTFKVDSSRSSNLDFGSNVSYLTMIDDNIKNNFIKSKNGKTIPSKIDWEKANRDYHLPKAYSYSFKNSTEPNYIEKSYTKNSRNFSFTNIDNDGYSTSINLTILNATEQNIKDFFDIDLINSDNLDVRNLTFYPNFENGKININFDTDAKKISLRILDNNGNEVFKDFTAVNLTYNKLLDLFKNGIYYLEIKSGNQSFIKKLIKN